MIKSYVEEEYLIDLIKIIMSPSIIAVTND